MDTDGKTGLPKRTFPAAGSGELFRQMEKRAKERESACVATMDKLTDPYRRLVQGREMGDGMEINQSLSLDMSALTLMPRSPSSTVNKFIDHKSLSPISADQEIERLERMAEKLGENRELTTKKALKKYITSTKRHDLHTAGSFLSLNYETRTDGIDVDKEQWSASAPVVIEISDSDSDKPSANESMDVDDKVLLRWKRGLERIDKLRKAIERFRAESFAWRKQRAVGDIPPKLPKKPALSISLKPDFTIDEEELFNLAIASSDTDTVLFERYNASITRSTVMTLLPDRWLNDEVINQYLSLLRERSLELSSTNGFLERPCPKCYFHLTHFYNKLMEDGEYSYSRVRRWTTRGFRKCDLFSTDRVFFPRNIKDTHWALAWVDIKGQRIEYLDSMGGHGNQMMRSILRYLADEHVAKKGHSLDMSNWKMINKGTSVPQQNNCNDCGVFLSTFCNYLSLDQPLSFSSADMPYFRKRILVDLMAGKAAYKAP